MLRLVLVPLVPLSSIGEVVYMETQRNQGIVLVVDIASYTTTAGEIQKNYTFRETNATMTQHPLPAGTTKPADDVVSYWL